MSLTTPVCRLSIITVAPGSTWFCVSTTRPRITPNAASLESGAAKAVADMAAAMKKTDSFL